jgi:hypothetical protein
LTFRMMLRVVSSMNSTRTCVTPPREPAHVQIRIPSSSLSRGGSSSPGAHTGTAEDTSDLHKLDGDPARNIVSRCVVRDGMLARMAALGTTHLAESIFAVSLGGLDGLEVLLGSNGLRSGRSEFVADGRWDACECG